MKGRKKIFTEIGFGVSTEIEQGNQEFRQPGFLPLTIEEIYFRLWIYRKVLILSIPNDVKLNQKERSHFKMLIGISDIPKNKK